MDTRVFRGNGPITYTMELTLTMAVKKASCHRYSYTLRHVSSGEGSLLDRGVSEGSL